MRDTLCIFSLILGLFCALTLGFPESPTEKYPFSETLVNGEYILYWKYNASHITFETHVKTLGWMGFGLSGNGKMYPADVVVGWVKDGKPYLEDRSTDAYSEPQKDIKQDWYLLSGKEIGDTTVLKFQRALDTCDIKDRIINRDLINVIYAWRDVDPDDKLLIHTKKGTKALYLIDPVLKDVTLPSDSKSFLITSLKIKIPNKQTYYGCTAYVVPPMEKKHHAIGFVPIVEAGNEDIVHHFIVHACGYPFPDSQNATNFECSGRRENDFRTCYHVFNGWAIGGMALYLPEDVGYPFGSTSSTYFLLEVHYTNDKLQEGRVDSSGFRIIYTPTLRKHDAGVMQIGTQVSPMHVVPPNYKEFVSRSICVASCLSKAMKGDDGHMTITSVLLHSHLLGRKLRLRHIRKGVELKPIAVDDAYDFDFQQTRTLREPRKVLPGDDLLMECVYDSTKRTSITTGGLSTYEEMCLAFVSYYPASNNLTLCNSYPTYNVSNTRDEILGYTRRLGSRTWTNWYDRQKFQCEVDRSKTNVMCLGNNTWHTVYRGPIKVKPYVPASECPNTSPEDQSSYDAICDGFISASTRNHVTALWPFFLIVFIFCSM